MVPSCSRITRNIMHMQKKLDLPTVGRFAGRRGNVRTFQYVRISLVRVFLEGLLGSPVPMLLVARTLNSYSTQGLNLVTVADSCFPLSSSGTERHHRNNLSSRPCEICHGKLAMLLMCYSLSFLCVVWKGYPPCTPIFIFCACSVNKMFAQTYTQTVKWKHFRESSPKVRPKHPSRLLVAGCSACDKVLLLRESRWDTGTI